jgi:hypothetical protein
MNLTNKDSLSLGDLDRPTGRCISDHCGNGDCEVITQQL